MTGSATKLMFFLQGSKQRFIIPVYQRNYDWKKENCKQLYDDLIKVVRNNRKSHFFGSIVSSYQPSGRYIEFLIIDGQQRLTTISLLLLAMYNLIREQKLTPELDTMAAEIFEDYLVDKHQPKETRIKLKPVKNDKKAFESLFDPEEERDHQSNLINNYEYFYDRILKEEISIDELYEALFTLEVIRIDLGEGDNPQLIFESLNSTGLALSEGDKIRNYILMGLQSSIQNEYYEKYWNKIELNTDYEVSLFVRDYLSIKQRIIPAMSRVYTSFKEYVEDSANSMETESLLKDMLAYAKRYRLLNHGGTPNKTLNGCIERLNRLETTITRPFFLEVLTLQESGALTWDDVAEVFRTTENYLFRRVICSVPTNALNKVFLTLHREIIRFDGSSDAYVSKLRYALCSKRDSVRFPDDTEFVEAFQQRPIYQMNAKNKVYILERLENFDTLEDKEIYGHCDSGDYSIEHIMPQHLTPAWVEALGSDYEEIHELWLHRLANLTLTGYNAKYSNSPFTEKRDMEHGFSKSGLRMNTWIAQQSQWTLKELQARNAMLMEQALKIWDRTESDYVPAEKQLDSYTLADDVDLSGREILRYEYCNTEQPVSSWLEMTENIIKILHNEDRSVLNIIAKGSDADSTLTTYFDTDPNKQRTPLQIDTDIYFERHNNTNTKLMVLKKLFQRYGANPENLVFYLKNAATEESGVATGSLKDVRRRYWAYVLPQLREAHMESGCFQNSTGTYGHWINSSFGISGFVLTCFAKTNNSGVEITLQKFNRDINKAAYDYLYARKDEIEKKLGKSLNWWRFDEGKTAYINLSFDGIGLKDESDWKQVARIHVEWSKKVYDVIVPLLWDFMNEK